MQNGVGSIPNQCIFFEVMYFLDNSKTPLSIVEGRHPASRIVESEMDHGF